MNRTKSSKPDDREADTSTDVTSEVGSEGGSPGDVEVDQRPAAGAGSEGTETWTPARTVRKTVVRDETGRGRRNP